MRPQPELPYGKLPIPSIRDIERMCMDFTNADCPGITSAFSNGLPVESLELPVCRPLKFGDGKAAFYGSLKRSMIRLSRSI